MRDKEAQEGPRAGRRHSAATWAGEKSRAKIAGRGGETEAASLAQSRPRTCGAAASLSPGCRRPRAAGWGLAPRWWRRRTAGGSGAARGGRW